jgi:hypothetical protein
LAVARVVAGLRAAAIAAKGEQQQFAHGVFSRSKSLPRHAGIHTCVSFFSIDGRSWLMIHCGPIFWNVSKGTIVPLLSSSLAARTARILQPSGDSFTRTA